VVANEKGKGRVVAAGHKKSPVTKKKPSQRDVSPSSRSTRTATRTPTRPANKSNTGGKKYDSTEQKSTNKSKVKATPPRKKNKSSSSPKYELTSPNEMGARKGKGGMLVF
jgi:hypothetical protein|tara:strand:- start:59 stop:388 length:330 start_codon:yes stop_codon:yes gene_type:complete